VRALTVQPGSDDSVRLDDIPEHKRPDRGFEAMAHTDAYGVVCLTGVSPAGRKLDVDAGAINREIVLENDVDVGSVNVNLRHYHQAAAALAEADPGWLERPITRRVPLEDLADAFEARDDDVKVVITLDDQP
jgi:threonine dehydrogenase-like Zn-dependent dehydrogenase